MKCFFVWTYGHSCFILQILDIQLWFWLQKRWTTHRIVDWVSWKSRMWRGERYHSSVQSVRATISHICYMIPGNTKCPCWGRPLEILMGTSTVSKPKSGISEWWGFHSKKLPWEGLACFLEFCTSRVFYKSAPLAVEYWVI